jgi:hypothetical protein
MPAYKRPLIKLQPSRLKLLWPSLRRLACARRGRLRSKFSIGDHRPRVFQGRLPCMLLRQRRAYQ